MKGRNIVDKRIQRIIKTAETADSKNVEKVLKQVDEDTEEAIEGAAEGGGEVIQNEVSELFGNPITEEMVKKLVQAEQAGLPAAGAGVGAGGGAGLGYLLSGKHKPAYTATGAGLGALAGLLGHPVTREQIGRATGISDDEDPVYPQVSYDE